MVDDKKSILDAEKVDDPVELGKTELLKDDLTD